MVPPVFFVESGSNSESSSVLELELDAERAVGVNDEVELDLEAPVRERSTVRRHCTDARTTEAGVDGRDGRGACGETGTNCRTGLRLATETLFFEGRASHSSSSFFAWRSDGGMAKDAPPGYGEEARWVLLSKVRA
jgi:hypothetical protein